MIRISQIKLPINHSDSDLKTAIIKQLKLTHSNTNKNTSNQFSKSMFFSNKVSVDNLQYNIVKKSIDARKDDVKYIYTVDVAISDTDTELALVRRLKSNNITMADIRRYDFKVSGSEKLAHRPVIIGCGPAGLFCAYMLALEGYQPLIVERGEAIDTRKETVADFFNGKALNTESNVQFGEGGAGTFSDGKLNTMVKDRYGRNHYVLETFVKFGADEKILYMNKPHIGTDVLSIVVKNMRNAAINLGAEFLFDTKMSDMIIDNGNISCIHTINTKTGEEKEISCEAVVLAIGHSSRDTFQMLYNKKIVMEPKSFAIGVRIEHTRKMIDLSQYGRFSDRMPAADYKLTAKAHNGRGVYSFCMCPGGYVVNSSSEEGHTCVNGMSYSGRNGSNSNSAIIVTVTKEDFPEPSPLGGMELQRQLERAAYIEGSGKIPVQMFGDFKNNIVSEALGEIIPQTKGEIQLSNLRNVLPESICAALIDGIDTFSSKIKAYNRYDAVLSGVESRTSSPLRITRNEGFESNIAGLYPCGEGAGYAGGITSAAIDGIKVFEAIASKYAPLTDEY